jgi:hypothetical protein
MEGHGVFSWTDGRKYDGEYKADNKHGNGTLTWPDGKILTGTWKLGRLDGVVTLEIKGKQYKGEWLKGKKQRWLKEPTCRKVPSFSRI